MKLNAIKYGEGFEVVENEHESLQKFKTGGMYEIEVKQTRNPQFHRKVYAFFNFCFEHWAGGHEFQDQKTQFDAFRKDLIILAGFYNTTYKLDSSVQLEAKSISFGNMSQDEFERLYNALINAAMANIFKGAGPDIENRLFSFF